MWRAMLILFSVGRVSASGLRFAVDYFGHRGVRQLCYMSCGDAASNVLIANTFIKNNMRVSVKTIDDKEEYDLQVYLNQWTVHIGVLIEGSCNRTVNVLEEASQNGLFDAAHIWLILDNAVDYGNAMDGVLQRMNLSVDADVVVATKMGNRYELMDIFNFGKIQGNNLERKYLGTWSEESGLNVSASTFKYYDRWDFHNLTLRAVTVVLGRPKVFESDMLTSSSYTKGISVFTKTAAQVLQPLRDTHNLRFNYTVVGRWIGTVNKNASPAVMNTLYWHQQDIGCTSARIFSNWLQWVDICHPPVAKIESRFFYLIPDRGVGNYENRFLTPLSPVVWWCAVGAGIFCAVVLGVSAVVEKRPRPGVYAVLSVLGAVCQQAYEEGTQILDERLSSQGGRLTMLVIGVTSMLLYNYYTSSVVSWLLSAAPPTLQDIDGLINSDFELIFEDIGYTRGWFEDAGFFYYSGYKNPKEDELRAKKIYNAKRTKDLYQPVEYGIQLIKSGDYAYHTDPYTAYQSISKTFDDMELCRLGSLPMINPSPTYIMTQKNSPYKQFFNWSLMRLKERGHITAIQARVAGFIASCSGSTPRALALGQAAPAFGLLAVASLGAVVILLGEIIWFRWNKKPIKDRSLKVREPNARNSRPKKTKDGVMDRPMY